MGPIIAPSYRLAQIWSIRTERDLLGIDKDRFWGQVSTYMHFVRAQN
jgi:hypothetical protein